MTMLGDAVNKRLDGESTSLIQQRPFQLSLRDLLRTSGSNVTRPYPILRVAVALDCLKATGASASGLTYQTSCL